MTLDGFLYVFGYLTRIRISHQPGLLIANLPICAWQYCSLLQRPCLVSRVRSTSPLITSLGLKRQLHFLRFLVPTPYSLRPLALLCLDGSALLLDRYVCTDRSVLLLSNKVPSFIQ